MRNQGDLFEQAVREQMLRLLGIARAVVGNRTVAEDVVQQAMVNLYEHRERYDWREPGALMRRTVVNEALRLLRQPRMSTAMEDSVPDNTAPDGAMLADETVVQVRRAIAELPDNHRAALVLCEYENMSYAEIAKALGASIPQVKTWIFRARRQLAGMLKNFVESP